MAACVEHLIYQKSRILTDTVTSVILKARKMAGRPNILKEAPTNATGSSIANWDLILISLVRRSMLLSLRYCGVNNDWFNWTNFAMRSRYTSQTGNRHV